MTAVRGVPFQGKKSINKDNKNFAKNFPLKNYYSNNNLKLISCKELMKQFRALHPTPVSTR